MKELMRLFIYIQKFYNNPLDVLFILLRFVLLKEDSKVLEQALSAKKIPQEFYDFFINDSLFLHPKLNVKKVLKVLVNLKINANMLENFIQTITLQKTILKLYSYATPSEINSLVSAILDIKQNERVLNPCCGIGSWLLFQKKDAKFYGVDIEPKLIAIANTIKEILDFKTCYLEVGDIFKNHNFKESFDKVFCHPPLIFHANIKAPESARLAPYHKTAPEIPFLDFALQHFSKKAVFIVRSSLLNKSIGEKLCAYLLESKMLEAVLELPSNIYPYQVEEFSLLVLSSDNKKVFFINAKDSCLKEGKYNKLINLEEILDSYKFKQITSKTRLLKYSEINPKNLLPSFYTKQELIETKKVLYLKDLLDLSYRGSKLVQKCDSELIPCYDLGIKDFANFSYTQHFSSYMLRPNDERIASLKVAPFDVLLSMRGVMPKVAIMGKSVESKVVLPNAGIVVLRFKNYDLAKAVYFYFLSKEGQNLLESFYKSNFERVSEKEINTLKIPLKFLDSSFINSCVESFELVCKEGENMQKSINKIKEILNKFN